MSLAESITRACGGDWHGDYGNIPTPGHSVRDRGTSLRDAPDAPDGLLVHSHNGGDALAIKDELHGKGLLPARNCPARARDTDAWNYPDASGNVLYRKVRSDRPDGSKTYRLSTRTVKAADHLRQWQQRGGKGNGC